MKSARPRAQGARTPEAAYACLGCEPQCGCCLDYAQEIIDEERGKRPPPRASSPDLTAACLTAHPPSRDARRRE